MNRIEDAHDDPINALEYISENAILSTGDDAGHIALWDFRKASTLPKDLCVMDLREHEDQITGLSLVRDHYLLSSSIDARMAVWDLRNSKEPLYAMSDNLEEDLTSVCDLKMNSRVACST